MAAIDDITELAQASYFSINGSLNDDTGTDEEEFQNNYIMAFNLWVREYEKEAYWNPARVSDYELATIEDDVNYSFELPAAYRTPIFSQNKYLKFVLDDGTVIARFKLVDPSQRQIDDEYPRRRNRATFVSAGRKGGGTVILSRPPTSEEIGAKIILDVVKMFPKLSREDAEVLDWVDNDELATLGVSKNVTLADVTKVSLSPSFTQKYSNELNKAVVANNISNENDEMRGDDFSSIGGIW